MQLANRASINLSFAVSFESLSSEPLLCWHQYCHSCFCISERFSYHFMCVFIANLPLLVLVIYIYIFLFFTSELASTHDLCVSIITWTFPQKSVYYMVFYFAPLLLHSHKNIEAPRPCLGYSLPSYPSAWRMFSTWYAFLKTVEINKKEINVIDILKNAWKMKRENEYTHTHTHTRLYHTHFINNFIWQLFSEYRLWTRHYAYCRTYYSEQDKCLSYLHWTHILAIER